MPSLRSDVPSLRSDVPSLRSDVSSPGRKLPAYLSDAADSIGRAIQYESEENWNEVGIYECEL